jgi:hypothetical protein
MKIKDLPKSDTEIRRFKDVIQLNDLKVNEPIVVIGEPNDSGQIIAKFIRMMPFPSSTRLDPAERVIRR